VAEAERVPQQPRHERYSLDAVAVQPRQHGLADVAGHHFVEQALVGDQERRLDRQELGYNPGLILSKA